MLIDEIQGKGGGGGIYSKQQRYDVQLYTYLKDIIELELLGLKLSFIQLYDASMNRFSKRAYSAPLHALILKDKLAMRFTCKLAMRFKCS